MVTVSRQPPFQVWWWCSVARIKVGRDNYAVVDREDYADLAVFRWSMFQGYAKREVVVGYTDSGKRIRKTISMHRQVMGFPTGNVDHKNRDKLYNRKSNLRLANKSENGRNRGAQSNSTTGIKGVCYDRRGGYWRAYLNLNGRQVFNSYYKNMADAIKARKNAELKYFGDFA